MPSTVSIDFFYDISCPFAYIASLRIPALLADHATTLRIHYRPVLLGAIYRATSAPQGAAGSASDTFNPTKRHVTSRGFARTIARLGVQHRQPERHPIKTTAALRLLYCLDDGQERVALTTALYRAYWVEGLDVSDKAVLKGVVERCSELGTTTTTTTTKNGAVTTRNILLSKLDDGTFESQHQRRLLEEATDTAVQRGAFGVPAFWIGAEEWVDRTTGEKKTGRLYWGQDRLQFVQAVLYAMERGGDTRALATPRLLLESLVPRAVPASRRRIPVGEHVKMQFFYDFSSPWAFLGWTQLARLKRIFGPRLHVEMKPFLLGILFREIGAPNLPSAAVSEAKRTYSQLDHSDWCRWWNAINHQEGRPDKNIDFYWADNFPIRTPTVLRAVLVEPRLVDILFRACWERNKDMSSDTVLHSVIAEAGYDADKILDAANSPEVKQELRARTKEAMDTGICGVPSYRIFRRGQTGQQRQGDDDDDDDDGWKLSSDIIWGQDELVVVEDLIAGWDGHSQATQVIENATSTNAMSRL